MPRYKWEPKDKALPADEILSNAVETANLWLAHVEARRERALEMVRLGALARSGEEGQKEAVQKLAQLNLSATESFNADKLEEAVRVLVMFAPN